MRTSSRNPNEVKFINGLRMIFVKYYRIVSETKEFPKAGGATTIIVIAKRSLPQWARARQHDCRASMILPFHLESLLCCENFQLDMAVSQPEKMIKQTEPIWALKRRQFEVHVRWDRHGFRKIKNKIVFTRRFDQRFN